MKQDTNTKPTCIDLDDDKPPAASNTIIAKNHWVPELGLTTQDRDILLHPTTWLNDRIIDAAHAEADQEIVPSNVWPADCNKLPNYGV